MRAVSFDEGFQASESLIPLLRYQVQVVADFLHGLRIELEKALTPGADAAHNSGPLENAEMLGYGLPRERRGFSELRD